MNLQCFEKYLSSYPEVVDFVTALATPSIAFMALVFAALQWHTNRNRLRHELFDRRYKQYETVKDFLGNIGSLGKMTPEAEAAFPQATKGMRFTYSKQIAEYVDKKVWGLAVTLNLYNQELEDPDKIEQGVAEQRAAIMKEILHELSNSEKVFSKYLQLRH